MCGNGCHRGGSDGRKALVPESRGAGTGAFILFASPWEAPAGRDRRGFPISRRQEPRRGDRSPEDRPD